MIVVVPPRTYLPQPRRILADLLGVLAQRLLDRGMHEDARNLRIGGRPPDELHLHGGEDGGIDGERILQHRHRGHILSLLRGQDAVRHGGEPDIGVEPDLMAGMAGQHRTAARLRHVSDKETRPAVERAGVARQPLQIIEELRGAPIAVAREPHHLPVGAVDGKRDGTGEAALGVGADRARGERSRGRHRAEQLTRRRLLGLGFLRGRLRGGLRRGRRRRSRLGGAARHLLGGDRPTKQRQNEAQHQPSHQPSTRFPWGSHEAPRP